MRSGASGVSGRLTALPLAWREELGVPEDPMRSLWATEGAFRFLTLLYSLYIHVDAVRFYTEPHLATALIGVQCIWTGGVALGLLTVSRWRGRLVLADQVVTVALMASTWVVAPQSWWDHHQSLPTTMWVTNAVLCAGMQWGVLGGFVSGVAMSLVSLTIGGDLSWLARSPTIPVLVSAGIAAGVGGASVRRAHAQLVTALELRARAQERERLARQVHDGVLQVLALVARRAAQAGGELAQLADLAAEQEQALRRLIADGDEALNSVDAEGAGPGTIDLRQELLALAGGRVQVSVGTDPVLLDTLRGREILAAVRQALVNTERHAGPRARSYVLLEDLGDDLVVTVRDDGVGIVPGRLDAAHADGRLGVSRSIVGRVEDLGGRAVLTSAPDEGTEWEFTLPR